MISTIAWMFFLGSFGGSTIAADGAADSTWAAQQVAAPASAPKKRADPTRFAHNLLEEASSKTVASDLIFQPAGQFESTVTINGKVIPMSVQTIQAPQASSANPLGPTRAIYEVTLHPGAGYVEKFLVAPVAGSVPRPLLVAFHKFGNSAYDILYNTQYFAEGQSRGWHVVAPLGASGVHFSSIESQINTEAVLHWTTVHFPVDKTRVYAVGFSMGGGAALNYAARHLDPNGVMFAAVVNHTGVVSLEDAYVNEPGAQSIFDFWFGDGTPGSAEPWKLQRSSLLSFDPVTLQVDPTTDLARNLMHLWTRTIYANQDPVWYLHTENDVLHTHLANYGSQFGQHALYVFPGTTHSWDTLNAHAACDWLRTKRLRMPKSGNTLADSDDVYFYFTVTQDQGGAFTPFIWNLDPPSNMLSLSGTANLHQLAVDVVAAALSPLTPCTVSMATADGLADIVRLRGWNHLPINVLRDGVATTSWSYDAQTGDLTLSEFDGAATHVWQVIP
jgi:pimeloyl-ACP methyl ester carboxylesterase